MSSIYLAGRFSQKAYLKTARWWLQEHGQYVTSRWLNGSHADVTDNAIMDLVDIDCADTLVLLADEPALNERPMQNTLVELGYAIALKKKIYVLDTLKETKIIFLSLPQITFIETWEDLLELLQEEEAHKAAGIGSQLALQL